MFERHPRSGRLAMAGVLTATIAAGCGSSEPPPPAPALQGPQIVQDMVEAHGGLAAWRAAPTVCFEDEWGGQAGEPGEVSRIVVEQSRRRMYLDKPASNTRAAWDGAKAWSRGWTSPAPPRFMALLNYYFLNLPWLTQDPGVRLGEPGTGTLPGHSDSLTTVLMTFEPGVGDTPDDYYRLYIDRSTNKLRGCAYIVTYQSLLPPGVTATPEHILVYDEMSTVNGLHVPVRFTIWDGDNLYARCTIRNWAFDVPFDESRMTMQADDVMDQSTP